MFANFGLSAIIQYSIPVLMFLYPLAIMLPLLALCGRLFGHDRRVYGWTLGFTLAAALLDALFALPAGMQSLFHAGAIQKVVLRILPFSGLGLGWICPALVGLCIGLALHFCGKKPA